MGSSCVQKIKNQKEVNYYLYKRMFVFFSKKKYVSLKYFVHFIKLLSPQEDIKMFNKMQKKTLHIFFLMIN